MIAVGWVDADSYLLRIDESYEDTTHTLWSGGVIVKKETMEHLETRQKAKETRPICIEGALFATYIPSTG